MSLSASLVAVCAAASASAAILVFILCLWCYRRRQRENQGEGQRSSLLYGSRTQRRYDNTCKPDKLNQTLSSAGSATSCTSLQQTGCQSGSAISAHSQRQPQVRPAAEVERVTSALSRIESARCVTSALRTFHPQILTTSTILSPLPDPHWTVARASAFNAQLRQPMGAKHTRSIHSKSARESQRSNISREQSSGALVPQRRRSSLAPVLPAGLNSSRKRSPSNDEFRRDSAEFWVPPDVASRLRAKSFASAFDSEQNGGETAIFPDNLLLLSFNSFSTTCPLTLPLQIYMYQILLCASL